MPPSLSIVLDACVLFPAPLRDTLLRAAEEGLYRPYWTDAIWDETTHNLVADGRMTAQQASYLMSQLRIYFPEAFVSGYETLIPTLACDKKDRHVLAAAIQISAHAIVTTNIRHFPNHSVAPHEIEIWHPDVFLSQLYTLAPGTMAQVIEQQAADLRRQPYSPDRVLEALNTHAPTFVALLRSHVSQE